MFIQGLAVELDQGSGFLEDAYLSDALVVIDAGILYFAHKGIRRDSRAALHPIPIVLGGQAPFPVPRRIDGFDDLLAADKVEDGGFQAAAILGRLGERGRQVDGLGLFQPDRGRGRNRPIERDQGPGREPGDGQAQSR